VVATAYLIILKINATKLQQKNNPQPTTNCIFLLFVPAIVIIKLVV